MGDYHEEVYGSNKGHNINLITAKMLADDIFRADPEGKSLDKDQTRAIIYNFEKCITAEMMSNSDFTPESFQKKVQKASLRHGFSFSPLSNFDFQKLYEKASVKEALQHIDRDELARITKDDIQNLHYDLKYNELDISNKSAVILLKALEGQTPTGLNLSQNEIDTACRRNALQIFCTKMILDPNNIQNLQNEYKRIYKKNGDEFPYLDPNDLDYRTYIRKPEKNFSDFARKEQAEKDSGILKKYLIGAGIVGAGIGLMAVFGEKANSAELPPAAPEQENRVQAQPVQTAPDQKTAAYMQQVREM